MRRPGLLYPLVRVVFSLLLACALILTVLGDAAAAPRLNDPLAQRVATSDGLLVQAVRIKTSRTDPVPPPTSADPEVARAARPAWPRGPEGALRRVLPTRTTFHGGTGQASPPIRSPPHAL